MARLTRQVGIRSAEVRLPPVSQDLGRAVIKTAATMQDIAFEKAADQRRQEATLAAAQLNFERDLEGNLLPPQLPIGDNGLVAPTIYDRAYTQMVGARYTQQVKLDTSKAINQIAQENYFDPEAFQTVVEGYIDKVTELAPDLLKPDVNINAQTQAVEYYNYLIREKAVRDHKEARGVQLETLSDMGDELSFLIESGADDEKIGAKMLEIRAGIEQGDELNYWLDDEKMQMLEGMNVRASVSDLVRRINSVPLGDEVATAEMMQWLSQMADGEGVVSIVDELGQRKNVPVTDVYKNDEIRTMMGKHAASVLEAKQTAYGNVLDARLESDWNKFFDWYTEHAVKAGPGGQLDMDRLYREFNKAHNDVLELGYDDTLREAIANIILQQTARSGSGLSTEEEYFSEDFFAWRVMMNNEKKKRLDGRDPESLTPDESLKLVYDINRDVGGLSSGNKQTAGNSRFISKYYSEMAGRDLVGPKGRAYFNDALQNPTEEKFQEIEWMAKYIWAPIGIWPDELSKAIIGKINDPEGMNQRTLSDVLRVTRAFWDNPNFRYNMTDENALGHKVGRSLDALFRLGGQPTPEELQEKLIAYADPNYSPEALWENRDDKEAFLQSANDALDEYFKSSWWHVPKGMQVSTFGLPFFDTDLTGYPASVKQAVMEHIKENSQFIDPNDRETFKPFIHQSVNTAMHEQRYAPSSIGYNAARFSDQWTFQFRRPDAAIVHSPPEYYARDANGNIDRLLMDLIEDDFQHLLDEFGKERGEKWKAGVNAALRFNAGATDFFGYPVWDVLLIRKGGREPDVLTMNGLKDGDNVPFTIQDALRRHPIVNREKLKTRSLLDSQQRFDQQTGRTYLRYHPLGDMSWLMPYENVHEMETEE